MLAYYVVRFFSWIMCVAPKCLRNLTAAVLAELQLLLLQNGGCKWLQPIYRSVLA